MKKYSHEKNIAITSVCITVIAFGGIFSLISHQYFTGLWQIITCFWIYLCFLKDGLVERYRKLVDDNWQLTEDQHNMIIKLSEENKALKKHE